MRYKYEVVGSAAGGQTWTSKGEVETEKAGQFPVAMNTAMQMAFNQLTQGKAEYGNPGVGCNGPYGITKFTIEIMI